MTGARGQPRDRQAVALDLVGLVGLIALAAGLVVLRPSPVLGFDVGPAIDGIRSQLPVTLPAAALVLAATVFELAAGLVLARLARRDAFDSTGEAAIAALTALVAKDAAVLGLLAGFGLFRAPLLGAIDLVILAAAWRGPLAPRARPLVRWQPGGWWRAGLGSVPLAALVAIVWLGPVALQLASPVVPFMDVLPNHVAPVEHLRTFGWWSPLNATFSPIYGPSRSDLGYVSFLGSVDTITGLPAALAVAAFILPSTLLVAAGVQRLAAAVTSPDRSVGPWALLAFAVTESFARLGDARATVVVLPVAAFALALCGDALAGREDGWRPGRALALGVALGATILLHPVIGAFTVATVGVLALARPERLAADALVGGLAAAFIALPQLGIMLGLAVPPLGLALAIGLGLLIAGLGARIVADRRSIGSRLVGITGLAKIVVLAGLLLGLAGLVASGGLRLDRLPDGLVSAGGLALAACGVLLLGLVLGWLVGSPAARSPVLAAGVVVGLAAALVTQLLPDGLGFLGDALRFEVPKTVHYWLPVLVAVAAGPSLGAALASPRLEWLAGHPATAPIVAIAPVVAVAVVVGLAAAPVRTEPIDALHLGEHRYAESLALDLRWAGRGFWVGYPDPREILDPPRRALADIVRREIDAGRIRHDTPILHVARSFQQWVATPLGVFDGIVETDVSPDHEVSQQTVGGRLFGLEALGGFIASRAYPYVVLEPDGLPGAAIRDEILSAGYRSIFANGQGEVFALAS